MAFVKRRQPQLWGMKKSKTFVGDSVLVALYKDLYVKGYHTVSSEVRRWLPLVSRTLQHNNKVLRELFAEWGETQIVLGTLSEWQEAAEDAGFPEVMNDVSLWMDSTDFALIGKVSTSRKSRDWSFKMNGPGRRYMSLMDARGQLRALWGGYSPKVYDSDFLELNEKWLEKRLQGATVTADTHFEWGSKNLRRVTFKTPIPKPRGRRKKGSDGILIPKTLTRSQEKYNKDLHSVRSRVENPFGRMAAKVGALTKPFREGKHQLDCLVKLAAGLLNFSE